MKSIMPRVCVIHAITISEEREELQSVYIHKNYNMPKECAKDATLTITIKLSGKNKR